MNFEELSETESTIIGQCLRAAVDGPFFPEWEFSTLFGLHREEVRSIANEWPRNSARTQDVILAINNSINHLLHYPHRKNNLRSDWIPVDHKELKDLLEKIRAKRNETYFDRLM